MKRVFLIVPLLAASLPGVAADAAYPGAALRALHANTNTGTATAVVVADVPLAHTMQMFPITDGKLTAPGDAEKQAQQLLLNLSAALREARSDLGRAVKLNVFVTSAGHVEAVQRALAKYFDDAHKPAVSFVETALPVPGVLVAIDAVAVSDASAPAGAVNYFRTADIGGAKSLAHAAVLPAGRKVFISGQAEKGTNLTDSTTRTLQSLEATLKHLELTRAHIVQIKSFFSSMANMAAVEKGFAEFFKGGTIPPLVFVEWNSTVPIEIELIAAAGAPTGKEPDAIEFITPPGMKPSPVYAKVARVNRGRLVYVSSLYSPEHRNATTQVREVFGELRKLMQEAGGDLKHLAKATYYVSAADVSKALNDIRPDYYDPQRPPAASKAQVRGVAMPHRTFTMDMIGVVP
ncbi:MAG TPA: Rid family hydrolase [Verrucomicrobiae bacterium]